MTYYLPHTIIMPKYIRVPRLPTLELSYVNMLARLMMYFSTSIFGVGPCGPSPLAGVGVVLQSLLPAPSQALWGLGLSCSMELAF